MRSTALSPNYCRRWLIRESQPRETDKVFAGAESGVILASSIGDGSERRRSSKGRP